MKHSRFVSLLLACGVLNFQTVQAQELSTDAMPEPIEDKGDLTIEYHPSRILEADKSASITYRELSEAAVLETTLVKLNESFRFPRNIHAIFKDCGKPEAFFDEATTTITVCYELINLYADLQGDSTPTHKEMEQARLWAAQFLYTHQLGHVLMQEFNFPEEMRQEKFYHQFILMLQGTGQQTDDMVRYIAEVFITRGDVTRKQLSRLAYAEMHPFGLEEARGLLCMAYGLEPEKNMAYVTSGLLKKERADSCEYEYSQTMTAWWAQLGAYMKQSDDSGGAVDVWQ